MKMSVTLHRFCAAVGLVCLLASCSDWIYENRDGCEHGIWLSFKYDYNLQRADMMEHVGSVGVFVYDEQGRFVTSYIDPDIRRTQPYRMYIDLPEGKKSGLKHAISILKNIEGIETVTLTAKDVVRHPLVMEIVRAYERESARQNSGGKK